MNHLTVDNILNLNNKYDNLWNEVEKIPGYITKNEGLILYTLSALCSTLGSIIEIGPFHGKSSVIMGKGITDSKNNNSKLICIDNFAKQKSNMYPFAQGPKSSLIKNIEAFGLMDVFKLYENDGAEALQILNKEKYGLIFIDSNHTEYQILKEFPLATQIIHSKGTILIHDYKNPSVEKGYTDWIDNNVRQNYETIFVQDSTPKYGGNGLLIVKPNKV